MDEQISNTNHTNGNGWVSRYGRWVIRFRWPIVILSLIVTFFIGMGAKSLYFTTDYRVFFGKDNPQLQSYEATNHIYTKNDNVLFVLEPEDGNVFTPRTLSAVEKLTTGAWKIPYAIRVDSLSNFQNSYANGDDLIVEDLVTDANELTPQQIEYIKEVATAEPLLVNRIISPQGHVTGINVTLQFPEKSLTELPATVNAARDLVKQIEEEFSDINVHLTGFSMLNNAFAESSKRDFMTLMPLMYLAMVVMMFFFLRSISGTFVTLIIISLSAMIAMGVGGWFKVGISPPSANAPIIIMTLAIADSIHLLVTLLREMSKGRSKYDAIVESLRVNMQPVILTSVSTVIGFLTMNFSDVPPFKHLGNLTAVGVTAAMVFALLFLPALMAILPVKKRQYKNGRATPFERLADFIARRKKSVFVISLLSAVLLIGLIPRNTLDDRFVEYFDKSMEFRQSTDFAEQNLAGVYEIHYSVGSGESGGISNPLYLTKLEDFANWFRQQQGVKHVNTFTDVMKKLNKNMFADNQAYYRLPDTRNLAAQYLLLYEMSLPYGLDLNNQINVDKSATRFIVNVENVGAAEIRELTESGQQWLKDNTPEYMHTYGSSPAVMFAYISGINIRSMIKGSIVGMILISLLLIFVFRSFRVGVLSLIPNVLPILMGFGIWSLFSGMVNLGLSSAMGMTLGIVVDDTIHFLSKYLRARRENGLDAPAAVRYAFSYVGQALFVTTVILTIGFGILSFSTFGMTSNMARFTTIVIILALIADFFLLPSLLMVLEGKLVRQQVLNKKVKTIKDRMGIVFPKLNPYHHAELVPARQRKENIMKAVKQLNSKDLKKRFTSMFLALTFLLVTFSPQEARAMIDSQQKGLEIAQEADRRDIGYIDNKVDVTMILRNRHGQESKREMRNRFKEVEEDGDKLFIIFDHPRDVYGTVFLSFTHNKKQDDQWLYLPALKRVKRISSNNKSGPFVGSEFAYEDLVSQEVEKYTYNHLRDETLNGQETFVVERIPTYEHSGYTKQIVWYDKEEYRVQKVEYYDRKAELLKTLIYSNYQHYLDQYWRADEMFMENHQTGKSTKLVWSNYKFRNDFTDRDFDQASLKRAR